jgi:hypothetical protein
MSARDPLAALQRLAALKAQRALADLAAARAREAAAAAAVTAATRAAADTYPASVENGGQLHALWRRRAALEAQGDTHARDLAGRRAEAAVSAAAAAEALARELGAKALAARAAHLKAQADARRHERSMGVLSALRGPSAG